MKPGGIPASSPAPSCSTARRLAVDERRGAHDRRPERGGHRLHAQADAQERDPPLGREADRLDRDAGVRPGRTGPGEMTIPRRSAAGSSASASSPARSIASLRTTRTSAPGGLERLDEVEGEAVVVVDDEDHRRAPGRRLGLGARPSLCGRGSATDPPGPATPAPRPGRQLDRPAHRRRLVLGLLELALRHAAGDDPGAGVDVGHAVLEHRAPDRDRGVEVAVIAEIADGAAVEPAPLALRRGDELHRPHLRGAGQGAGREDAAQRVERVEAGGHLRLDVAHEVEHVAVALHLHVLRDPHRARPGDPAEVVAARGPRASRARRAPSGRAWSCSARSSSSGGVAPRGRVPGDRVGRHPVALDLEEQLRAGADHLERRASGRRRGRGWG